MSLLDYSSNWVISLNLALLGYQHGWTCKRSVGLISANDKSLLSHVTSNVTSIYQSLSIYQYVIVYSILTN